MQGFESYAFDEETGQLATPKLKAWRELVKIAPRLDALRRKHARHSPVPVPLNDQTFLCLAACFADPTKRELLKALILDLLADDLEDIIFATITDEPDENQSEPH